MTTGNRPYDPSASEDHLSAVEDRLRDALSAAAATAVEPRPLAVPSRRARFRLHLRLRLPAVLAAAATVTAAAITLMTVWPELRPSASDLSRSASRRWPRPTPRRTRLTRPR
nr:hypothetical protein GCM10020093_072870 [Planobispora longispora]